MIIEEFFSCWLRDDHLNLFCLSIVMSHAYNLLLKVLFNHNNLSECQVMMDELNIISMV